MTAKRLIGLPAAALTIVLVVAGCGSSGDGSTETAVFTKGEFIRMANAICAATTKEIQSEFAKAAKSSANSTTPVNAQAAEFATTVMIPALQNQVDEVRALGPPKGDGTGQVNAILDAEQEAIDASEKAPVELLRSTRDPFAKANKLAKEYGLGVCAQN